MSQREGIFKRTILSQGFFSILLVMFLFFVLFSPQPVNAQSEISSSYYSHPESGLHGYDVYSPKIACNDNNQCYMLSYEKGTPFGKGISIEYSLDGAGSFFSDSVYNVKHLTTIPENYDQWLTDSWFGQSNYRWANASLPYDIIWSKHDNVFYYFYHSGLTNASYIYNLTSPPLGVSHLVKAIDGSNYTYDVCRSGLISFLNDTAIAYAGIYLGGAQQVETGIYYFKDDVFVNNKVWNIYTNAVNSGTVNSNCTVQDWNNTPTLQSCSDGVFFIRGDAFMDSDGDVFYHFAIPKMQYGTGNTSAVSYTDFQCEASGGNLSINDIANYTTGAFFYKDNTIYYYGRANVSIQPNGVSEGVWAVQVTGNDFNVSSFDTPFIYYNFTGNPFRIQRMDFDRTTYRDVWMLENETGAKTVSSFHSLWGYNIEGISFSVSNQYMDKNNNTRSDNDVTVTVSCRDSLYETTQSGQSSYVFIVPCENITVTGATVDTQPNNYEVNLTLLQGQANTLGTRYFGSVYQAEIVVRDAYTREPVGNATVNVNGNTYTTVSNGSVYVTVQPISSASLELVDFTSKDHALVFSDSVSSPRSYSIDVSKADYRTFSGTTTFMEFVNETVSGQNVISPRYYSQYIVDLTPIKTELIVNMFTHDLELWTPVSGILSVSGGNDTQVYKDGLIYNMSATSVLPAHFIFSNTNTFTANLTFTIGDKTMSRNVTVVDGEVNVYNFISDYDSIESPCFVVADCPNIGCSGLAYYGLDSCANNICSYVLSTCSVACDDSAGCYDINTSDVCVSDAECHDECFSVKTLTTKRCGSDGYCKGTFRTCQQFCNTTTIQNQTVDFCQESEACVLGTETQNFSIQYVYTDAFGSHVVGFETGFVCDSETAGRYYCIGGEGLTYFDKATLQGHGITLNDFIVQPQNWLFVDNTTANEYQFLPVSVHCSDTCELTWDYCNYRCDSVSGQCTGTSDELYTVITSTLPDYLAWIFTSFFIWTVLSLVVGALLTFAPNLISRTVSATPTPELGLGGIFIMFILGVAFQFVPVFLGLIIVIGIGLWLAWFLTTRMTSR